MPVAPLIAANRTSAPMRPLFGASLAPLRAFVVAGALAWSGRQREPQCVDRGATRG